MFLFHLGQNNDSCTFRTSFKMCQNMTFNRKNRLFLKMSPFCRMNAGNVDEFFSHHYFPPFSERTRASAMFISQPLLQSLNEAFVQTGRHHCRTAPLAIFFFSHHKDVFINLTSNNAHEALADNDLDSSNFFDASSRRGKDAFVKRTGLF